MTERPAAAREHPVRLARVLGGLVATALLARVLPEALPHRGTLAIVPLVVGLLAAVPVRTTAAERLGLPLLLVVLVTSPLLGLPGSERVLAAGGFLLLLAALGRRLAHSVRAAGEPSSLTVFLLASALYIAILPWATSHILV